MIGDSQMKCSYNTLTAQEIITKDVPDIRYYPVSGRISIIRYPAKIIRCMHWDSVSSTSWAGNGWSARQSPDLLVQPMQCETKLT